jgi:hypothetical protein
MGGDPDTASQTSRPQVINGRRPATAGGNREGTTVSRIRSDKSKIFSPQRKQLTPVRAP